MNSFRIVLLACFIGLAFAQFDLNRLRDILGDDADELLKRIEQNRRGRSSPFGNHDNHNHSPFGDLPKVGRPRGGRNSPFGNNPFGGSRGSQRGSQRGAPKQDSKPSGPTSSALLDKKDCICRIGGSKRIVNGKIAEQNSIPWQVSLASNGQHFCGGSVINKKFILTAAHCVDKQSASQVQVRVGLHYLRDANSRNTYQVSKIHIHPYSSRPTNPSKPGDYAILELSSSIEFIKGKVEPGCIANKEEKTYTGDLIASGWGTTSISRKDLRTGKLQTGQVSPVLKMAFLRQDDGDCEAYLVCVNSKNKGDSVCQGDSGGPLHFVRNGHATIEGVASFVTGTSSYGSQTVELCTGHGAYSGNHYYKEWFDKIIGQNYCKL